MAGDINIKPVPKSESERRYASGTKELKWRKLMDSERDRLRDYYRGEYFAGSVFVAILLVISLVFTVITVFSSVVRFNQGEHMQALVYACILIILYALLITLTRLLIHQPKRELNAISNDTAIACETSIESKYLQKRASLEDYISSYRLRCRADVRLPYDEDGVGNVISRGRYPLKAVGMNDRVYRRVKNGEDVLVVFFPENPGDQPDEQNMEIFRIR